METVSHWKVLSQRLCKAMQTEMNLFAKCPGSLVHYCIQLSGTTLPSRMLSHNFAQEAQSLKDETWNAHSMERVYSPKEWNKCLLFFI